MAKVTTYYGKEENTTSTSIPIDPVALEEALKKRGLEKSVASKMMGYNPSVISHIIKRGIVSANVSVLMEKVLGIPVSEYVFIPKEEKAETTKEPEPKEEKSVCADETALYLTMKLAMKDAMTEWFADNVKNLRGTIYAAIMNTKK